MIPASYKPKKKFMQLAIAEGVGCERAPGFCPEVTGAETYEQFSHYRTTAFLKIGGDAVGTNGGVK